MLRQIGMDDVKKLGSLKVTVPIALLGGLVWLGFKADDLSLELLDDVFFSEAQAQSLSGKVNDIEKKVDTIGVELKAKRVADLEESIFALSIDWCMSTGQLKRAYEQQRAAKLTEWRGLMDQPLAFPTTYVQNCGNIG